MFKKILLASVLFVLVPATPASAQWLTNPNGIHYNSGKVGIGTSLPLGILDISGSTPQQRITHTSVENYGQLNFFENTTQRGALQMIGSSFADSTRRNHLEIVSNSSNGDISIWPNAVQTVTFKPSGNVGIGTTSPTNMLTVGDNSPGFGLGKTVSIGNSSGDSSLVIGQDTVKNGILYWDSASSKFKISSGYTVALQPGGGKVGIGTGNNIPSATFEVKGTIATNGSSGTVTTGSLSTPNAWYTQFVSFPYTFVSPPRVTLTQDNSGSGDISIISLRVKKNSVTTTGFTIEYYVNAIPTNGSTKFNWTAFQ